MKNLITIACCISLSLYSISSSAQQKDIPINEPDLKKPELFRQSPEKISIHAEDLTFLLATAVGETVVLSLPSFRFEGNVVSAVSKYSNAIQSVVVRSSNFEGATLTISRITDETGKTFFTGKIISLKHGDLYELKLVDNGFAFLKNSYYKVINE